MYKPIGTTSGCSSHVNSLPLIP